MKLKPSFYNHWASLQNGKQVLFNFFTGKMIEVPDTDFEKYIYVMDHCNTDLAEDQQKLKKELVQEMYLIPEDVNELDMIRIRNLSSRYDSLFYNLVIMPTLDCNFACKYCYESRDTGYMSEELQKGLISWINKISRMARRLQLTWFGGEPLMDFSIVENINSHAKAACAQSGCFFHSDITTNGYLLTDEILSKVDDLRLTNFQITIDGPPEYHNKYRPLKDGSESFDVILKNVFRLLDRTKAQVALRINVDKENYSSIPKFLKMIPQKYRTPQLMLAYKDIFSDPEGNKGIEEEITNNRIKSYQIMKDLYTHSLQEGFEVFIPALKIRDHHCNSGSKNYFIVHPSGDLYRCTVEFENGKTVGHLLEDGNIIIDSYTMAKWLAYTPGDDEKCAHCKFLPMCQGGCRYNRIVGKNPCSLEATDLDGIIELYYLSKSKLA